MWKKFDLTSTEETMDGLVLHLVKVQGYLDSSTFTQLQDHLEKVIGEGKYNILVEFGDLNYISSAGLGVLLGMSQEVREHGGDLKLANMSSKIRNLFEMLGFSRLIRIYDDVDTAKQAFYQDQLEQAKEPEETRVEDGY